MSHHNRRPANIAPVLCAVALLAAAATPTHAADSGWSIKLLGAHLDPGYGQTVVNVSGEEFQVSLVELMPMWLGDFLLVWRPAAGTGRVMTPGSSGQDVAWLRQSVAQVLGEEIPADNATVYDDRLRQAVEQFQRTRRLRPDGVAGARTMIALNSVLDPTGRPRLKTGS